MRRCVSYFKVLRFCSERGCVESSRILSYVGRLDVHTSSSNQGSPLTDPENRGLSQRFTNFDTLGTWNNKLSLSVDYEKSMRHGRLIPEVTAKNVGVASLLGRRNTNEDRYIITELMPNLMMFAIFDGHGGSPAVDYVHQNFAKIISSHISGVDDDLSAVLRKAFETMNATLTRHLCRHAKGGLIPFCMC